MKKPKLQSLSKYLKVSLLILTIILFVGYFINNRETFSRISNLSVIEILLIIIGQLIIFLANSLVVILIGRYEKVKIGPTIALRVTAYSSLINFFGFLQGGVGFRGIYLKRYFSISYKRYFLITALQYIILFSFAALMIGLGISSTQGTGYTLGLLAKLIVISAIVVAALYFTGFYKTILVKLTSISTLFTKNILLMSAVMLMQLLGSMLSYGVALHAIGADLTLGGLLIFTGISQFAIVIALTPGAIGIREGLLLLVQSQMLINTSDIILASTIDRLMYFILLILVIPLAISLKIKDGDKLKA